jgi:1-aminocyclopropane-1-carboxylate deaminase
LGFFGSSSLKGSFLESEIAKHVLTFENWSLNTDYHFGGYARINETLVDFINEFREQTQIPLDPVYTGKMMFGVIDLIRSGRISEGSHVLAIHTGGLQGIDGMNTRLKRRNMPLIQQ